MVKHGNLKWETKMSTLIMPKQHSSSQCNKKRKKKERQPDHQITKGEMNLFLFTDNVIVYVED